MAELNRKAEDPKLWSNPAEAKKVMRQRQSLENVLSNFKRMEQELDDNLTLIALGEAEGDEASLDEADNLLKKLAFEVQEKSIEALLSGEDRKSTRLNSSHRT
mgnify:CR=1 FL=1